MRLLDLTSLTRSATLFSFAALLSACPKKENEAAPEPAAPAAQSPASDKAGAEAPAAAPAKKKDDDKGGW